jgi:creatinine amidohydrolase
MFQRAFVLCFLCVLCFLPAAAQELPSRWMDELNWMEFRQIVPAQTRTVLLTTGTLEPHGVINNGADNLAPVKIAEAIADEVNALIAPHIGYGVTGSMAPYPGATHIPADTYAPYVHAVLESLAGNGFTSPSSAASTPWSSTGGPPARRPRKRSSATPAATRAKTKPPSSRPSTRRW